MIEVFGNLWTFPADLTVITTNGTVKKNGECVMGRGCAREACFRYPDLPKRLGKHLQEKGNIFEIFLDLGLATFPVKHEWHQRADLDLIKESADALHVAALVAEARDPNFTIVMPRPGCGNGNLKWEDVKPVIDFLPDNIKVITFEEEKPLVTLG